MTRERAKDLLPVIQAYADGKDIQFRYNDGLWVDHQSEFNPDPSPIVQYRVKPEPREFWIGWCHEHGPHRRVWDQPPPRLCNDCVIIHVREVV